MKKETLVTIIGDDKPQAETKYPIRPSKRSKHLARRGQPSISFYDLGQVNHQSLSSAPIWEDHPILKTPSYSTVADEWGTLPHKFAGVIYTVDPFDDTDYQAYTDMMFAYPVTEWTRRYRKIGTKIATDTYPEDVRVSIADADTPAHGEKFLPDSTASHALGAYNAEKAAGIAAHKWVWDIDANKIYYRGLNEVTGCNDPDGAAGSTVAGYFGFSTGNKDTYKITTTYNSSAPDVGGITPRGNVDVFLMPEFGLFASTSQTDLSSPDGLDYITTQVLGPVFQITPRIKWPGYIDGRTGIGTGGEYGNDTDVSNYIAYQKARSGMQASTWTWTGTVSTDITYSLSTLDPLDWDTLDQFGFCLSSDPSFASGFFSSQGRGGNISSGGAAFSTGFVGPDDTFWGASFIYGASPLLVAVIKTGAKFYYVWDIYSIDNDLSWTGHRARRQGDRFLISRNINWNTDVVGAVPLPVKDGSGAFPTI